MSAAEVGNLAARILEVFVWPATIIAIVIMFRASIKQLILKLSSLRYGGVELEFSKELQEVESKAQALELPSPQALRDLEEPITITSSYERLFELASYSPRAAITEAWIRLEGALQEAAQLLDFAPQRGRFAREVIDELVKRGKVSKNATFL